MQPYIILPPPPKPRDYYRAITAVAMLSLSAATITAAVIACAIYAIINLLK